MRGNLVEAELTHDIIGAFYAVYNTLGFGFLEALYMAALERELLTRGHRVGREVYVPVSYRGVEIGRQRLDMVVNDRVVVEAKSTEVLHRGATRQIHSYLRATRLEVGLLLHFGPTPKAYRFYCSNESG
jgi:GxxExxY protein